MMTQCHDDEFSMGGGGSRALRAGEGVRRERKKRKEKRGRKRKEGERENERRKKGKKRKEKKRAQNRHSKSDCFGAHPLKTPFSWGGGIL